MARETEMSSQDIDAKLAALEEEPEVEVEVEPEQDEVEEVEEESAASEDDTDDEEPLESEGDDDEEEEDDEEEVDLSKSEEGLLKTAISERKKRQEVEAKLEAIQESLKNLESTVASSQQPRTLEEAYERDPKGVIDNINANIAQAVEMNDTLEAERLRDLKDELKNTVKQKQVTKQQEQQKQTEIATLLYTKVPDFGPEKAKELTEFAIKQLGYEDDDLTDKTNVAKHGVEAIKEIVRINTAYEKFQVPNKAKQKKVKKATPVEKGGKGIKKTVVNEADLIKKARKSGDRDDWAAVIEARFSG